MKVISVANNRCVGCRLCEQWCSYFHEGVVKPAKARIRILRDIEGEKDIPLLCRQCSLPLCMKACPVAALSRDEKTGAIIVNREKCVGCGMCVDACPHGAIGVEPEGYPLICDLCGGKPQCIAHCPEGVIRYQRRELIDREKKMSAARQQGGVR
jgi:Fe-S-cluster-containing hydrogenase component 2